MKRRCLSVFIFFLLTYILLISQCDASRIVTDEERKIAEKYLQELSDNSNSWVDPYDMFADEKSSVIETPPHEEKTNSKVIKNTSINSKTTEHHVSTDASVTYSSKTKSTDNLPPQPASDTQSNHNANTMDILSVSRENTCVSSDHIFLTRWLKKFLNKVEYFTQHGSFWEKIVSFTLTDKHVSQIRNILRSSKPNVMDVESVIFDIFDGATISDTQSWLSLPHVSFHFFANEKLVYIAAILVIVVVIVILSHYLSCPRWVLYLTVVVVSVGFQWTQLYEEAVARKAAALEKIDYKTACRKADLGLLASVNHYFKSFFVSSESCEEYYKAVMVDPLWEVSLMKAISLTFSKFMFAPLEALAQSLNIVLKELFSGLSPVVVGFLVFFILIALIMLCNYRVRLPYLLAYLEPSAPAVMHITQEHNLTQSVIRRSMDIVGGEVQQLLACGDSLMIEQPSTNFIASKSLESSNNSNDASNLDLCSNCRHEIVQDKATSLENTALSGGDGVSEIVSPANSTVPFVTEVTTSDCESCVNSKETSKIFKDSEENHDDKLSPIFETDLKRNNLLKAENALPIERFESNGDCQKCSTLKSTEMECSEPKCESEIPS